jgi:dUTP pyrophosphatase
MCDYNNQLKTLLKSFQSGTLDINDDNQFNNFIDILFKEFLKKLTNPELKIKYFDNFPFDIHPNGIKYNKPGDIGIDCVASFEEPEWSIIPGMNVLVPLGISVEPKPGYATIIAPRSSIVKTPLIQPNSIGIIDCGYRGELKIPFKNTEGSLHKIKRGERICQLIVIPAIIAKIIKVDQLSDTERGSTGFGDSGKF